jgi:hypothetical protein
MNPYPSYYVWAPSNWSHATYAHLGMSSYDRFDTKGIHWSLW